MSTNNKTSPHWFRMSFVTQCLSRGVLLFNVMKGMRHEYISTINKYLHDISEFNSVFDVYLNRLFGKYSIILIIIMCLILRMKVNF